LYRNRGPLRNVDDAACVNRTGVEILRTGLPVAPPISPDTLATIDVRGLAERIFFPFDVSHAVTLLQRGQNVLAVEVHQSSTKSEDLSFDLELCANLGAPQFPPRTGLATPLDGSLHLIGQPIMLRAEAIDPDGQIAS